MTIQLYPTAGRTLVSAGDLTIRDVTSWALLDADVRADLECALGREMGCRKLLVRRRGVAGVLARNGAAEVWESMAGSWREVVS